jgi:N-glycosylase/DNA lyase
LKSNSHYPSFCVENGKWLQESVFDMRGSATLLPRASRKVPVLCANTYVDVKEVYLRITTVLKEFSHQWNVSIDEVKETVFCHKI